MTHSIAIKKEVFSIKKQALFTVLGIALSVILPQFFHLLGIASGTGNALGKVLLPMHLPVIFIGLFAGPWAGAITGLFGPLISFSLTGMPAAPIVPFMIAELFGYGLCAGLLRNVNLPNVVKVFITMIAGRVLRMLFCILMIYVFANQNEAILSVWKSLPAGLPGILLQITLIPLVLYRIEE